MRGGRSVKRGRALAVAALAAVLVGGAVAAPEAGPRGFLAPGAFDILAVLPPAPVEGDVRAEADRAIFRATRRFQGTPRWDMATNDVQLTAADMMRDFSCAAGVTLTPATAPKTLAFVTRAAVDTTIQTNRAKDFYKRRRPYLIDPGAICQPAQELAGSYDYPSGHTTYGWTWATLLAWIEPDRATPLLARGRAYGESRVVCGVHNASAVEGGRLSASATLDAVAGVPAFQADLKAARREIAALRRSAAAPPDGRACATEAALVADHVY